MVTGSHNPADENGFKLVRKGAVPISGDSGLFHIRDRIASGQLILQEHRGIFTERTFRKEYIDHLLTYIKPATLRPFRIVADPGNGCAGLILNHLAERLPLDLHIIHGEPDGTFPNGVPNPLLPGNRELTAQAVRACKADFGLAWDGDFDRCFFYDADGRFIEGYYIVGLIAEALLSQHHGAKIIHDPRLIWNTQAVVRAAGGIPIESKTGHAFIKERMRAEDALYGGEMSAHHYFRNFAYCDSGMISWLLVTQLLSDSGRTLAEAVNSRMKAFPCSGEINSRVENIAQTIARVENKYAGMPDAAVTHIDGLSIAFPTWRFNLRGSNTEPVLRLNVESRGNVSLLKAKTEELLKAIRT